MDYKKYSLENLENWLHDALSCEETSPHEIYSVIRKVVQDEYNYHKEQSQKCLGVLELLSGHRPVKLECDKDDPSPECQGAWNDFWEQIDEEVKKDIQTNGYEWTPLTIKKEKILDYQEAVAAGWEMTGDGFWIPPTK